MQKYLIGVIALLFCTGILAQKTSFNIVDSISYKLYENKKWTDLIAFRKIAKKAGHDYHYMNLRIGIAYFHTNRYMKAEKYLRRAYKQNSGSKLTAEYLYATALENENILLAGSVHENTQNDTIQFTKPISSLTAEGGIKASNNKIAAGDITYYSLGVGHLPFKKLSLFQNFLYQFQNNNIWGKYKQYQYYIGASLYLGKNWTFDASAHLHQYQSVIDYSFSNITQITKQPAFPGDYKTDSIYAKHNVLNGNYKQTGVYYYAGFTRRSGGFKFSPFIQINTEQANSDILNTSWVVEKVIKSKPMIQPIESTTFKDSTELLFKVPSSLFTSVAGVNMEFTGKYEVCTFGFTLYKPFSDYSKRISLSPYLKVNAKRFHFFLSYFSKQSVGFSEFYGSVLVNTYDIIHQRINAHVTYDITKKINIGLLYQYENKTDILSYMKYSTNMFSVNLNYKF
jgi:hypothetical protein